ncbi:MAG TPA: carboxypeptidase-like regulatory domain-containing protein [Candidatus Acidoferrales bacterium]|nr:carboxypeptidase-like regulatory domain-containing protein [Candidatus Acidoferrales bacterium]
MNRTSHLAGLSHFIWRKGIARAGALALALLAQLIAGSIAWGQATTSIRGTVTDSSGGYVGGASVTLTNPESKIARTATTGDEGGYQFLFLPPGTYTLEVLATGFQKYEQMGLQLLVNTPVTVNVQLKVGGGKETVTVTAEEPALNLVDASIGNSFDETQVRDIPLEGRNVPDLLSLQAGVAYTGNRVADKDQDTRNGSVNGARSDQSNVTLDGVDVNDQSNGYAFTSVLPVTQDSVQEFRVTTTNYGADQGQGSGAQVALVTKSGTNTFHGSAYENLRNTVTSANDYLVKQSELNIGLPNKPLQLKRNIFGASVGGPLRKDRLFFFTNYEGTREREEQRAERVIPTPSLCQGIFRYQYLDPTTGTTKLLSLTPTDLKNLDPRGIGIDPAMLDLTNHTGYLDKTFCTGKTVTNDPSAGDSLNYAGFVFRAPTSLDNDVFIARADYRLTSNGTHTLFWRGAVQNLRNPGAPFLPGDAPQQTTADHSKGFAFGYTAILSSTLANSFHWGYTRQSYGVDGISTTAGKNQPWNTFLGLDQGITYSHSFQVGTHNLLDDLSWTKNKHSMQFGAAIALARDPRTSYLHSAHLGLGTTNWTSPIGFSYTSSTLDPSNGSAHPNLTVMADCAPGMPCTGGAAPEPSNATQYDRPLLALYGMISDVVANYNLDRNGIPQNQGDPVKRNYGLNWYEFYGQDTWRIKPNFTLTYGLRWSLFPPPWETNGLQTTPTFGLGTQFDQNVKNMKQGLGYTSELPIAFNLGGPVNHRPGFYNFEKTDFSPRISVAYSPRPHGGLLRSIFGNNDKTVLRAGFSRVYDRAGFALLNTSDSVGSAGLTTTLQNACCTVGVTSAEDLPRIAGINTIPTFNFPPNGGTPTQFLQSPPIPGFPQVPGVTSQANLWANDDTLKTPHAYAVDFSVGRELPKRFSLQVSYVGRFGHRLLTQRDLSQPLDIVDPKTGIDYYRAAAALSNLARSFAVANNNGQPTNFYSAVITPAQISSVTAAMLGPTSQYWVDMLPPLRAGATAYADLLSKPGFAVPFPAANSTDSLLQAVFDLYYNPALSVIGDEIVGLADIDSYGGLGDNSSSLTPYFFNGPSSQLPGLCPGPFCQSGKFLSNQAFSMYGWSSVGTSNYHALQVSLRKQLSHGLQFDFNYTFSKSIDITSAASRVGFSVYGYQNIGLVGTRLANAFSPNLARAVSDFDLTHQMNLNWIADLPVGKGRALARGANGIQDAFIGGWQLSGLARWTSGFPFSVDGGQRWPTDWFLTAISQMTARPKTGVFKQNGSVSVFADPVAAQSDFTLPLPGGVGSRNVLRGDGFASWDMSLGKRWKLPRESQSLQFRWEGFNVPNLTRFNAQSVGSSSLLTSLTQQPSSFGAYTSLLTQPRVMQFALRYEF